MALGFLGIREAREEDVQLAAKYEQILLGVMKPRFLHKTYPIEEAPISLSGRDIAAHLAGCSHIVLMCTTLGAEVDALIRRTEVGDLSGAVMLDALAGAAVEQACGLCEEEIRAAHPGYFTTWRFSPGYGDFPLEVQGEFLRALDAGRRIGLTANKQSLLIPRKSVTAVVGLSKNELEKSRLGCASCRKRETCIIAN